MKKIVSLLLLLLAITATAATEVNKTVVNIIAYDAEGSVLRSGYGFYISAEGRVVAPYTLLRNATRAEVIDFKGQRSQVTRILGASASYDIVTFLAPTKKAEFLTISNSSAKQDEQLTLGFYTTNKKEQAIPTTVIAADSYESYAYYTISADNIDKYFGCPMVNAAGQAVGIVQKNVDKKATTACAIDARFAADLKTDPLSVLSTDLRELLIPKALPDDPEQAFSYVYMLMLSGADSVAVVTAANDYIQLHPDSTKALIERANFYAGRGNYAEADQDLQTALSKNIRPEEVHYALSNIIYNNVLYFPQQPYSGWTLERALQEADAAYAAKPLPLYLLQQGNCLFGLQRYKEAYEKFEDVNKTNFSSPQTFYYAANALHRAGGDSLQVIALLDSALARFTKPYPAEAAPYLLERAQRYEHAGMYRKAVFDLVEYEHLVGQNNLTHTFYYMREQLELRARMFQQALDDIRTTINRAPAEEADYYRVEEALIYLQAGSFEEAIKKAQEALKALPENPDCYKIVGIAQGELGQKASALENLKKAQQLGDDSVEAFIEKYK